MRRVIKPTTDDVAAAARYSNMGYRRISRKHGHLSRVDRPDWEAYMVQKQAPWDVKGEGMRWLRAIGLGAADHYRRCYSKDTVIVPKNVSELVGASSWDTIGYVDIQKSKATESIIQTPAIKTKEEITKMIDNLNINNLRAFGVEPRMNEHDCIELRYSDTARLLFYHPGIMSGAVSVRYPNHTHDVYVTPLIGDFECKLFAFCEDQKPQKHQLINQNGEYVKRGDAINIGNFGLSANKPAHIQHGVYRCYGTCFGVLHEEFDTKGKDEFTSIFVSGYNREDKFTADNLWHVIKSLLEEEEHEKSIRLPKPGYHTREIAKGVLGEPSKIMEELAEFEDAVDQGVALMALIELSDVQGAIRAYLEKHHPTITMGDLEKMNEVTRRAFQNGRR